jgi:hypothetical protein
VELTQEGKHGLGEPEAETVQKTNPNPAEGINSFRWANNISDKYEAMEINP